MALSTEQIFDEALGALRREHLQLRKEVEDLKREVPCEDCKGGIYPLYCPTCEDWRGEGNSCLACGANCTACPTCRGSGLKYFPAGVAAPAITATFAEPSSGPFSVMLGQEVKRVGLERAKLIDDASIKWLKEDEHGCRDYRTLYIARFMNGCAELRVADHTRGEDHTVLLKLAPIVAGYDDLMGGVPTGSRNE